MQRRSFLTIQRRSPSRIGTGLFFLSICLFRAGEIRAQSLDKLVVELLDKNPAVLVARRAVEAKRSLVSSARALPEPSVTLETMGNLVPPTLQAGDPSSARVLRVTQEIPFPAKLRLQGQIASSEADVELLKYEEVLREVVAELKTAYYDLVLAQKTAAVVEKNKNLLTQIAEISEARYKVGQAAQQDVLKAQVEVSRLLDRQAVLRRESATAEARINSLLYRPPQSTLGPLPELSRPKFDWSFDKLYEKTAAANPTVLMIRKEVDRSELSVALAKKSFYPDFEIGFSYYNRRDLPEMYGLMFRVKMPLYFRSRQRPELESAASDLVGKRHQYDNALSTLSFQLKDAYLKTRANENLLDLYGEAVIPQASLALESSISGYRVGSLDFLSLLSNLSTLLEYEIKYQEVLVDYWKTLAILESLTGEALTP